MYLVHCPAFPVDRLERYVLLGNGDKRPVPRSDMTTEIKAYFHGPLDRQVATLYNPVCVWHMDGKYVLRYGQSRFEACLRTGYPTIPALVSGPESSPPEGLEGRLIDLRSTEEFLACFRDPPYKWWIKPEGFVDFAKCWGTYEREVGKHCPPREGYLQRDSLDRVLRAGDADEPSKTLGVK